MKNIPKIVYIIITAIFLFALGTLFGRDLQNRMLKKEAPPKVMVLSGRAYDYNIWRIGYAQGFVAALNGSWTIKRDSTETLDRIYGAEKKK